MEYGLRIETMVTYIELIALSERSITPKFSCEVCGALYKLPRGE